MRSSVDRRRLIWVVDDSPTDVERVRRLLAPDHDVEAIFDGAAMLERLASGRPPDLIVLDWMMPGISGIEICQYVRSAPGKIAQTPIVLLTVRHGAEEILQAFRSGANDYVAKPFVDEELRARISVLLESRRLRERVEQAEADARTMLANAPDPILGIDAQGAIVFANQEALQLLDRPSEQVLGRSVVELIPGIELRNITLAPGESFLPLPDLEIGTRICSPSLRILPSDSAAVTTIALRDVTERRRAEARRLDFYSIIAHDLRSPLTSVLLRLDRAFRGIHGVLPASLIADLRRIEASLRSLVGVINDFLELARLEGVGHKIDRQPVDLAQLVRATMEDFQPLLDNHQLAWVANGLGARAMVLGDRQRLSQVISNLVSNAIKFTPPHGSVSTTLVQTEDHVEVSIEDTGRGIPCEEQSTIFERFTRARGAGEPGTGLGLMIVREVVEAHGGLVGVESKPGIGSRFWFRVPRQRTPRAGASSASEAMDGT